MISRHRPGQPIRARQHGNDVPRRHGVLLHRHLGRRRYPADAGTEDAIRRRSPRSSSASPPVCCRDGPCRCRRSASSSFSPSPIWEYGIFHLADYPVFLGVAAYLALVGLQRDLFGVSPLDVVRWTAGITLMWASIEKWAYPEWSYPLFSTHPDMSMGFDPDFFMRAAGAIEFALAFALMWTPLVRRVAAIMLSGMFVSAVLEFGKVDLDRPHADRGRAARDRRRQCAQGNRAASPWLIPVAYAVRARGVPGDLLRVARRCFTARR